MNQQLHKQRVQELGCVVCRFIELWGETPAELHHPHKPGTGRRAGDCVVIPLCKLHHRGEGVSGSNNKVYVSRHPHQRKQFEERYLPEADLLMLVRTALRIRYATDYAEEKCEAWFSL